MMGEDIASPLPTENPAGDVVLHQVLVLCGEENTKHYFQATHSLHGHITS